MTHYLCATITGVIETARVLVTMNAKLKCQGLQSLALGSDACRTTVQLYLTLERSDLACILLAHHELESLTNFLIVNVTIIFIITVIIFDCYYYYCYCCHYFIIIIIVISIDNIK